MTTGRINQVTIVRRVGHRPVRGGELVTGGGRLGLGPWLPRPSARPPASAGGAHWDIRFPPLCSPGVLRRARRPHRWDRVPPRVPRRSPRPAGSAVQRPLQVGVSRCSVEVWPAASGPQSPALVDGACRRHRSGATWLSACAVACAAPGVDRRHEPP